jgi:hypothetical protein
LPLVLERVQFRISAKVGCRWGNRIVFGQVKGYSYSYGLG